MLERIIKPVPGIQLGPYVQNEGKALFQLVKEKGMEGVIAKRKDSIYRPGKRMKPLFADKSPFVNPPNIKEKIQWVKPKLVCEIEYAELTDDEQLRQTTFLGWRAVADINCWISMD